MGVLALHNLHKLFEEVVYVPILLRFSHCAENMQSGV
jgi:hypothetical protein